MIILGNTDEISANSGIKRIVRRMDKEAVVHIHHGILLSH